MLLNKEWEALYRRIEITVAPLHGDWNALLRVNHYRDTILRQEINECVGSWANLVENHRGSLSATVLEIHGEMAQRFQGWESQKSASQNASMLLINMLRNLELYASRFSYELKTNDTPKLQLTERAFSHLQRRILAEPMYQTMWKEAYEEPGRKEERCERLGASHFLLHGVWCFKANDTGRGGRTDLIMTSQGRGLPQNEVLDTSDALVLTEWKVLSTYGGAMNDAIEAARVQAHRYGNPSGILGALELQRVRYLVVVSRTWEPIEQEEFE